jgi:hypothetical protein
MRPKILAMLVTAATTLPQLQEMTARFAPVELRVDTSKLSAGDRSALVKLIQAARVVNHIFLQQIWSGNPALYDRLRLDTSPVGKARLEYFQLNKGPWSDLDDHKAFLADVPERKPLGANFYPPNMTRDKFESWAKTLTPEARTQAEGFFTVIRSGENGKLRAVPYSEEYKADLAACARDLREAARLTDNSTLKHFLETRAAAFLSNDYYASDVAWMDLDAPLDITIGPYETYNDEVFGYKAAFEAYINIRDDAETAKLKFFGDHMQEVEDNLPIDAKYRNSKIGALSPIRVVNQVFAAGDGDHGVKTAAYNLPNDERVVHEKGSKRVMLKNVQEVKFHSTLEPVAKTVLTPAALTDKGAFMYRGNAWEVDAAKIRNGVRDLAHDLLTIEATGDYAGAKRMLDTLGVLRPETGATLGRVGAVPVDIRPVFETADRVAPVGN